MTWDGNEWKPISRRSIHRRAEDLASRSRERPEFVMAIERGEKLRLVCVTAVLASVATYASMFAIAKLNKPAVPTIEPPTSIKVTLYPVSQLGFEGLAATTIPPAEYESVMRLIRPAFFDASGIHDGINPLVAEVEIAHEGAKITTVFVRSSGVNPALVSVDGSNYFYAENHQDVFDGSVKLFQVMKRIVENQKRAQ